MDSPLLPSFSKKHHPPSTASNLFDTSLESLKLQDLSFPDDEHLASTEPYLPSHANDLSFDTPPRQVLPKTGKPRFSLFAQPRMDSPPSPVNNKWAGGGVLQEEKEEEEEEVEEEELVDEERDECGREDNYDEREEEVDEEAGRALRMSELDSTGRMGEEREATLRRTLFDLQRLNGAFEGYVGALESNNAFHSVSFCHSSFCLMID